MDGLFYILESKDDADILVVLVEPVRPNTVSQVAQIIQANMPVHIGSAVVSAHAWVTIEEIETVYRLGGKAAVRTLLGRAP